jgi:hypothetical protein
MRKDYVLVSFIALAGCGGGGGPQTVSGSSIGGGSTPTSPHTFVAPTEPKTYSAIGGVHSFQYFTTDTSGLSGTQGGQAYAGNASTARNSAITITYNPRDSIFDIAVADTAAGVSQTLRFQDPLHRTAFGGLREPQGGTPDITGKQIQYLQAGSSSGTLIYDLAQSDTFPIGGPDATRDVATFFYQKPGATTKYVSYAGFVRNATVVAEVTRTNGSTYLQQSHTLERAAFAFGERTDNSAVPRTGTATYTGDMLASMVYNPLPDTIAGAPTYFQWITGTASTTVNFGANSFSTTMAGTVQAPQYDIYTSREHVLDAGATFTAAGSGQVDLVQKGGFAGQVTSASFNQDGTNLPVNISGSSIDGAFFGPGGTADKLEVGGGFRIVGGTPDERIDILGTYTGTKAP